LKKTTCSNYLFFWYVTSKNVLPVMNSICAIFKFELYCFSLKMDTAAILFKESLEG
jgi:hypothetical protein